MASEAGAVVSNKLEYDRIIEELSVGVDMDDDVSRKMSYNACLDYAKRDLGADFDVNVFLEMAAERFDQVRVHFAVIKGLVPMPEDARLHLKYAPVGGPVLTGNTTGLRYLSDLCAALADTPVPEGDGVEEHIHLYDNEPPMFGQSYGLTIYHSGDAWFDRYGVEPSDTEAETLSRPPREISPEQIAAIEFFEENDMPLPPVLYLRYDKLYRALDFRQHLQGDGVWTKPSENEENGRRYVFTIRDDAQEIFEIALHLDDVGVHYFTKIDLEQICGANMP